jgi:hypothetical protein
MSLGPPIVADGPAPQPPQFTLIGAAQIPDDANERWMNGVQLRTYPCGPAQGFAFCGTDTIASGDGPGLVGGDAGVQPFGIYLPVECQVRHGALFPELEGLARVAFAAREPAAVEREFELGEIESGHPTLTQAGADILNAGDPTSTSNALSLLEQAIADSGVRGVIHCTPRVASRWSHIGGLSVQGGKLVTPLGTPVVPGYGYTGAAPEGGADPAAGQSWAYATGPVQLRRQAQPTVLPDTAAQAVTRPTNLMQLHVERIYWLAWDECLHAAVLADPCQTTC